MPALVHLVANNKAELTTRKEAAWALEQFGPAAAAAVPTLVGIFKDAASPVALQQAAVSALARIGARAVPALVDILKSEDWATRFLALEALDALGPAAREALPALRQVATGKDILLARAAARIVKSSDPKKAANHGF